MNTAEVIAICLSAAILSFGIGWLLGAMQGQRDGWTDCLERLRLDELIKDSSTRTPDGEAQ